MQLTQEDLDEFKAIYRRECNTDLTDAEALRAAHAALTLVQAVYRPLSPKAEKTEHQSTALSTGLNNKSR